MFYFGERSFYDREQFPSEDPDEEEDPSDADYEPHPFRP